MTQATGPLPDVDPFQHYDAPYVLGALSIADRREFEAHLAGCPSCSAAVAALAGIPGLLGSVPGDIVESLTLDPQDPPATLLPRLVARANRRRRIAWVAVVGAAAAVIVAFTLVFIVTRPAPATQNAGVPVTLAASGNTTDALSANAHLVSVAWGTRIDLKCSYHEEPGWDSPIFVMTVTNRSGTTESVASWTALPGKTASLTGSTATKLADIAALDVRDTAGDVLLHWTP